LQHPWCISSVFGLIFGPVSRDSFGPNEVCLPLFFCSASAASVERKDREKKKKKIERLLNVDLVSMRQLFYCSALYRGLGFEMLAVFQSCTLVNAGR